jgi:hypothetical protein
LHWVRMMLRCDDQSVPAAQPVHLRHGILSFPETTIHMFSLYRPQLGSDCPACTTTQLQPFDMRLLPEQRVALVQSIFKIAQCSGYQQWINRSRLPSTSSLQHARARPTDITPPGKEA